MDKTVLPDEVNYILDKLDSNNFEGYIVGGCVRDSLLNKIPNDWDITTNAKPEQVKQLFDKTIDTGLKHGTVTVVLNGENYEVTTYRTDGKYSDNRRPDSVVFTSSLKDDLSRRDFTINSIAYNHNEGLIDYFNGKDDLKNHIIKAVGSPNKRFQEDALRMMRAIRFSAQHDFDIEPNTEESIRRNSYLLQAVSKERIRDEMCKILISDYPGYGIEMLERCNLLEFTMPELCECVGFDQRNIHHDKNVFEHIISVLNNSPKILNVRLAALLHDIAKPQTFTIDENDCGHFYGHHIDSAIMAEEILKRLKFDNKTIESVVILVREHMSKYDFLRKSTIKKFINRVGVDNLDNLFHLQIADMKGSKPPHNFTQIFELKTQVEKILNEKQPLTVRDLAVNGHDLMGVGVQPGVEMGQILNSLLESVLEDPSLNTRDKLLELVKNHYES